METLKDYLGDKIGHNIIIMTSAYPFFFVGKLEHVMQTQIYVKAEFGVPAPLKEEIFCIQIESIAAFFAEDEENPIPVFK